MRHAKHRPDPARPFREASRRLVDRARCHGILSSSDALRIAVAKIWHAAPYKRINGILPNIGFLNDWQHND